MNFCKVFSASTLFFITVLTCDAYGSEDGMRNRRMNACVKLLQQNDKALRNSWRGGCNERTLDEEIASGEASSATSDLPLLFQGRKTVEFVDDALCKNAVTPIARSATCGLGSLEISTSLNSAAAMKVRMPGGKCAAFIPVLLSNKTDFACNAIKSRIACVEASHDDATDRTRLVFSARQSGNTEKAIFEFGKTELDAHDGRLSDLIVHPQFTIVPALIDGQSVVDKVLAATREKEKNCIDRKLHSAAACHKQANFQADAIMQEAIRRYRNPRHDSPRDAIARDGTRLVDFLKSKGIDQTPEQWILFLSVAANEVGLELSGGKTTTQDPIYGVSDAVYGNSGLSFGAHQIDLGANEDAELDLFWKVIEAYRVNHPDAVLDRATIARNCIDLPLKLMTVAALSLTYQATPNMTTALRSADGFDEYNKRLLNYLKEETSITAGKPGMFRQSMIARILFSDLRNQVGSGSRVQKLVDEQMSAGLDLKACTAIVNAENAILSKLIFINPDKEGDGKTQYAIRYENIRRIVRQRAAKGGVSDCH